MNKIGFRGHALFRSPLPFFGALLSPFFLFPCAMTCQQKVENGN